MFKNRINLYLGAYLLVDDLFLIIFKNNFYQLFLERERAAQLAESKTDELIKDAPTTQHDKSGEWQETSGEIQWVSTEKTDGTEESNTCQIDINLRNTTMCSVP